MPGVLTWNDAGTRLYETGVDHGVLYIPNVTGEYDTGVAWNGLISVTESPSGAEPTALYADNIKYISLFSAEEFSATIEAYTYPDEFAVCDGLATPEPGVYVGQQARKMFGLSYRSKLGNDVESDEFGYKLHLVYGCMASPSERAYNTQNDSPEAITFSWAISTTPAIVSGMRPTSLIVISTETADPIKLLALEALLYGAVATEPSLPSPDEVITLMHEGA